jgi:hypothetical protein
MRPLESPRVRQVLAMSVGGALALVVSVAALRCTSRPREEVSGAPAASRRVVVPLPFRATHVTFDEQARDLAPPVDVVAFEVPRESGARHRVTAVGEEGALAEAYVREADGVARPEGSGYEIESLEAYPVDPATEPQPAAPEEPPKPRRPRPTPSRTPAALPAPSPIVSSGPAKPAVSTKDGFTKLK